MPEQLQPTDSLKYGALGNWLPHLVICLLSFLFLCFLSSCKLIASCLFNRLIENPEQQLNGGGGQSPRWRIVWKLTQKNHVSSLPFLLPILLLSLFHFLLSFFYHDPLLLLHPHIFLALLWMNFPILSPSFYFFCPSIFLSFFDSPHSLPLQLIY